jgi:hypothetical protein
VTDVVEQASPARPSPWQTGSARSQRRRRLLLGIALAFLAVTSVFGPPTGREVVTAWLLLLLYAVVGGDAAVWRRTVVQDWLPFLLVLFAYDLLRGFVKDLAGRAHVLPQLRVDEFLFGGIVPTVWLQEHLYTPSPAWYDYAIAPVYLSHFLVPTAVAAGLWATSYVRFRGYVWTFVTLTAGTITTYAAFPAEPPWLASQTHPDLLAPVVRVTSHTLQVSGIPTIHNAVQRGEAYANPVAAVPSLHAAVPLLILLLAWPYCRWLGRTLLTGYVLAMAFTLVYGGEHYVSDILLGWAYAAASVAVVAALLPRFDRRMQRRRAAPATPV